MKEAYIKIPIIGWMAVLSGHIVIKENSKAGNKIGVYMNVIEKLYIER